MATKFDLPAHAQFVEEHSETVTISHASKCPCGNEPDAARANVNCRACGGLGLIYAAPQMLHGMVVGVQAQRQWIMLGLADMGDLVLSLSPFEPFQVRDWDRVLISGWNDGELYSGEVVRRGAGPEDGLRYQPVNIRQAFSVRPGTGEITPYSLGASFHIDGKRVVWDADPQPTTGLNYTIEYDPLFEWIAFNPTVARHEQAQHLGQRVLLRKRHLVVKG